MARDAGANKVYFASAAPPVKYPNVYGIDMPSATEFIAHGRTEEDVCKAIGADWLVYQDMDDLVESCGEYTHLESFECSVFTGEYISGDVDQAYLERLDAHRNDAAKNKRVGGDVNGSVVGIHNAR
jgi:amidophosphoribosyltransferase